MGIYTLQANKSAIVRAANPTANDHSSQYFSPKSADCYDGYDCLLLGFPAPPVADYYKKIVNSKLCIYGINPYKGVNNSGSFYINDLFDGFDEATVTYNDILNERNHFNSYYSLIVPGNFDSSFAGWIEKSKAIIEGLENFAIEGWYSATCAGTYVSKLYTSHSAYVPYVLVTHSDADVVTSLSNMSPISGYILKARQNIFSWAWAKDGQCYKAIKTTSSKFRWRTGSSATATEINCGTALSCTIPANTFTTDTIQWQCEVVTDKGDTMTSPWYTLSTNEPAPTATPKEPISSIVDGSIPSIFKWDYSVVTGTPQYAFELQKSTDNTAWSTLVAKTVSTDPFVSVSAGSLSAGTAYWRVKVYNNDDVASEWSSSAQITVVAAPDTPAVTIVSQEPHFGIRWTNAGQQGYEIRLDGVSIAKQFGTANNYTYTDWLADGEYTVSVRIQNNYGLWSGWGSAALNITNTAGNAITLTASGGSLSWATEGAYDKFVVYRDRKKIAETTAKNYVDNFACGTVSYKVRGIYTANGSYGVSSAVSSTITYNTVTLYDTVLSQSMELPASIVQTRSIGRTAAKDITLTHYSGSEKPVAEAGRAIDRTYKFECAFKASDSESRAQFETMLGHIIFVADHYGNNMFGVMSTVSATQTEFYTAYDVTITEVDYDA